MLTIFRRGLFIFRGRLLKQCSLHFNSSKQYRPKVTICVLGADTWILPRSPVTANIPAARSHPAACFCIVISTNESHPGHLQLSANRLPRPRVGQCISMTALFPLLVKFSVLNTPSLHPPTKTHESMEGFHPYPYGSPNVI